VTRLDCASAPKPDNAVRGEQHDDEEAETDEQTEAMPSSPIATRKSSVNVRSMTKTRRDEWTDRTGDAADDGDDENVDRPLDAIEPARSAVVQDLYKTPPSAATKEAKRIGGDAVRVDVEPKRRHAARLSRTPCKASPNGARAR